MMAHQQEEEMGQDCIVLSGFLHDHVDNVSISNSVSDGRGGAGNGKGFGKSSIIC